MNPDEGKRVFKEAKYREFGWISKLSGPKASIKKKVLLVKVPEDVSVLKESVCLQASPLIIHCVNPR